MGHDTDGADHKRVRVYDADHDRINSRRVGDETQADVVHRLLENAGGGPSQFAAEAEISVSVPEEDLDAIRDDIREAIADATGDETVDARIVDMDAAERQTFAEEVAGVLQR